MKTLFALAMVIALKSTAAFSAETLSDADYSAIQELSIQKIESVNSIQTDYDAYMNDLKKSNQDTMIVLPKIEIYKSKIHKVDYDSDSQKCQVSDDIFSFFNLEDCVSEVSGQAGKIRYMVYFSSNEPSASFWKAPFDDFDIGSIRLTPDDAWSARCNKDQVTDEKHCTITNSQSRSFAFLTKKSKTPSFSITGDAYPFTDLVYRFKGDSPIYSDVPDKDGNDFSNKRSLLIHKSLMLSKPGFTRYTKWPQGYNVDAEFDGTGYKEAYQFAQQYLGRRH